MKFRIKYSVIIFSITCVFGAGCQYSPKELDKIENKISVKYEGKIEQLSKEMEKLTKQIEKLQKEKDELKNLLDEEMKQSVFLKSELGDTREKLKDAEQKTAKREENQPAQLRFIRGKIMSIQSSDGAIIISLGKKDNITVGSELEVYRKTKLLGKIKVAGVQGDWSTAYPVKTGGSTLFKIGDDILLPVTD